MDGIDKIISRIEADARSEREALAVETEKHIAEIRERYKQQEQESYGFALKDGATEANAQYERLIGAAQLESKKLLLAEKQTLVGETFDLACKMLLELPEEQYVSLLAKYAADASRTGTETLVFSPRDHDRVGLKVAEAANNILKKENRTANLTLSKATRDINGGLIVSGGDIEVNCAVDRLVAVLREKLEPAVAGMLFD